ncbi:MAG: hypothetical protein AAF604_12570 [Acidobacteriota bacterium]
MNRARWIRSRLMLLALAGLLLAVPAVLAQEPEAVETSADGDEVLADDGVDSDLAAINQMLEGDEEAFEGDSGYTYDPGDRRDPFKSLLAARDQTEVEGRRPDGVPGLLIDEIDLTGVFKTGGRWVAQVQAADKDKGYLLREGDQLYDGDVIAINRSEVIFRQIVRDRTALKPFREVAKKLNP